MSTVRILAGSRGSVSGTFTDELGTGLPSAHLASVRLTLSNIETENLAASPTEGIINAREDDEVFAASPSWLSVDDQGAFTLTLEPDDNVIVVSRRQIERHRVALKVTTDGGQVYWWTDIIDVLALPEAA